MLLCCLAMLLLAGTLIVISFTTRAPQLVEGTFFGGGAALLVAGLCACHLALHAALRCRGGSASTARFRPCVVPRPIAGRSLLAVGLLASALFIIVAVAANTRDLSRLDVTQRASGAGGFALRAITALPLQYDLNSPEGRRRLGFSPEDEALFRGVQVYSFLLSPGEDIQLPEYRHPMYPRVLGVRGDLLAPVASPFATLRQSSTPWQELRASGLPSPSCFLRFADSAEWTLSRGLGQTYTLPVEGESRHRHFTGHRRQHFRR